MLLAAAVLAAGPSGTAAAATGEAPGGKPGYRPWLDGTATAVTGLAFVVLGGGRQWVAPQSCRWCTPGPLDARVHDGLAWRDPGAAKALSDVSAAWLVPSLSVGAYTIGLDRAGILRGSGEDYLVILEAVAITGGLSNVAKLTSARRRPYAHFAADPSTLADDPERNLSFVSSHTSLSFSLVFSTATLATLRKSPAAPWLWGVGVPMAAFTGYLRMGAERHYLSDVLAGAALGTAVGVVVPLLVHSAGPRWKRARRRHDVHLLPSDRGFVLVGRF